MLSYAPESSPSKLPPFGAQKDLIEAIDKGDFPSWTVKVQIMTEEQAKNFPINPFDLTKVWPHKLVPLIEVGQFELNRNVDNYFAETEQSAFAPSNLVPGIGASPDKMLQARLIAYQDAQRYRLGANHNQIPVNHPKCPVHHYQRDGLMAGVCPVRGDIDNQGSSINFYPNDQSDLPKPEAKFAEPPMPVENGAWVKPYDQGNEDYYTQAGDLFRLMSEDQKNLLCSTIGGGLCQAEKSVQERMLGYIEKADADYASRVRAALE